MFGVDPNAPPPAPRQFRLWVIGLQAVCFGLALGVDFALAEIERPWGISEYVNRWAPPPNGTIQFRHVRLLPGGSWTDPTTWTALIEDVRFTPHDPTKPSWSVQQAVVAVPDPARLAEGVAEMPWARVSGLSVVAVEQRRPPPWEPRSPAIGEIRVGDLTVADASYYAPEDKPLGEASLEGLFGELKDVVFFPGKREVSGTGRLHARRFTTGSILLEDVELHDLRLQSSDLHFDGSFDFLGTRGQVIGDVLHFHTGSESLFSVSLQGVRLADLFLTATGNTAPIDGDLDLDLEVRTGGSLPRGGGRTRGEMDLTNAILQLAPNTRYLILDLIRLAPSITLDANNTVHLGDTRGVIHLRRGFVGVQELVYSMGKREVEMRGFLEGGNMEFVTRLVPRRDPETRPGIGLVIGGAPRKPKVRFAKRAELLGEVVEEEEL